MRRVLSVVGPIVCEAIVDLHAVTVEPDPLLCHALTRNVIEVAPQQRLRLRVNRLAVVRVFEDRRWVAITIPRRVRIPTVIRPTEVVGSGSI